MRDDLRQPFGYKLRKLARYVRLYGPGRTIVKVRGRRHMQRSYERLPSSNPGRDGRRHVGFIGCGNFAFSSLAYYLQKDAGQVIRGCMDVDPERAASFAEHYGLDYHTDDADKVLDDNRIDLIFIVSNHASHAEYAIKAIERGKAVHIEKPHAVTFDQLERLREAVERHRGRFSLGFNRPESTLGRAAREALWSEDGPQALSWFVVGHHLPNNHWYLNEGEGGRVLGNLCHWTDFLYWVVPKEGRYPIEIQPLSAPDGDMIVTFRFGDGTIAAITFTSKGETFDGIRERFSGQRGDVQVSLTDFEELVVDRGAKRSRRRPVFRDHGHRNRVRESYRLISPDYVPGERNSVEYLWESAELFLAARDSVEQNRPARVFAYRPDRAERGGSIAGAEGTGS